MKAQGGQYMATGRSMQLTKQVGEYLVCAELCRRGLIATTFAGNVPDFDVLAINEKLETIPIQVKTITKGAWQFDAKTFLEISISNGTQKVERKISLPNPDLICIFVRLKEQNRDEFYIFRMKDLQEIIYEKYSKWLCKKKGKRPRKPSSTHCTVYPDDLKDYKNKWELITK
jgi:hypothetical protein